MDIATTLQDAVAHHQAGELDEAGRLYQQVLVRSPQSADAWHLSGVIAFQRGRLEQAEQQIRQALRLHDAPDFHANLASVLLAQGRAAEARESLERCLGRSSRHPLAHCLLGNALRAQGRRLQAVASYRRALELAPADGGALSGLGGTLVELGRLDEARPLLERAIEVAPRSHEALGNLGSLLRIRGEFAEAERALSRALELAPNSVELRINLANLMQDLSRLEEAAALLREALDLAPEHAGLLHSAGLLLQRVGDLPAALDALRRAAALAPQRFAGSWLFSLTLAIDESPQVVFEAHRDWGREVSRRIAEQRASEPAEHARHEDEIAAGHAAGRARRDDAERPLRIAYLSGDFRRHAAASFILPFLAEHRHDEFEVHAFGEVPLADEVTERTRLLCTGWQTTCGLDDDEVADCLRDREIDIAIDLAGHTAHNRLMVLARRPAPVQVSFLGYPQTTGLAEIDYFITDTYRDPPAERSWYVERLARLPSGACCYLPPEDAPAVVESPCLRGGRVTLGSLHRLEKLNDQVLSVWGEVLRRIPDAELLIVRDSLKLPQVRDALLSRLDQAGVPARRVRLEWEWRGSHLDWYSQIDLLLAVFPWGGGTTSYESMWMGVPAPAPRGDRPAARAAAAALHYLGRDAWIADDLSGYVDAVVRCVSDRAALATARSTLRSRMRETVCDASRFARELEGALRDMWRVHCGAPPSRLYLG